MFLLRKAFIFQVKSYRGLFRMCCVIRLLRASLILHRSPHPKTDNSDVLDLTGCLEPDNCLVATITELEQFIRFNVFFNWKMGLNTKSLNKSSNHLGSFCPHHVSHYLDIHH